MIHWSNNLFFFAILWSFRSFPPRPRGLACMYFLYSLWLQLLHKRLPAGSPKFGRRRSKIDLFLSVTKTPYIFFCKSWKVILLRSLASSVCKDSGAGKCFRTHKTQPNPTYCITIYNKEIATNFIATGCKRINSTEWTMCYILCTWYTVLFLREFLTKHETNVVPQPPYSPNLAPADLFLLPKLKSSVKGRRFRTVGEIEENPIRDLRAIPQNMFQVAFQNWKKRWTRCIKGGGEYFEGDKFD